ncbi:unnamed protein product [Urochloa decumbens]|uniref:Uncharacterized protein n=1 Tax=Urochloa decumbens TaxID=240449 RepID=A0ABC9FT62_9POAL
MMDGGFMVCYSTGVIEYLVEKLNKLMMNHPKFVQELLQDLDSLRKDLENISSGVENEQVKKVWMKQVRELLYDIEDWVELEVATKAHMGKTERKKIKEFKDQIKNARERCKRYDLLSKAPTPGEDLVHAASSEVLVDSGLLWEEKTVLVGLDGPKMELENNLKSEQIKKLKVLSILGMGGHGKTTLAKEIYRKLKGQFDCQAFVSVRRDTSTRTILLDILHQVKPPRDEWDSRASWNEQGIISELWHFLGSKRYFVLIDDIWNVSAWNVIKCALPDKQIGSRILTTTRFKDVAVWCTKRPDDFVYEVKPFDKDDSRKILLITVSAQRKEDPIDIKSSDELLKMCSGVPLAIAVTGGLLADKAVDMSVQLKMINRSINSTSWQYYETSQWMEKILDISYANLPLPVKSCFLYLSVFPENCTINKDRLIWRWIAEGLIPTRHGKRLWETGEVYFNYLIKRRLIEPTFNCDDDQPMGCVVHGVIHDFIASLSSKENLVTKNTCFSSEQFPCDVIRRYSVHYDSQDEADTLMSNIPHLSSVRSLTFFLGVESMPDLSGFKLLRVLDMEDTKGLKNNQLKSIASLLLLRYLGLAGTSVIELPDEIGQLEHLVTLDIRRTGMTGLPAFTTVKLVSLLSDCVELPRAMREMQYLEEVSTIHVSAQKQSTHIDGINSARTPQALAELVSKSKRLRMLGIKFVSAPGFYTKIDRQGLMHFLDEVAQSGLQFLSLHDYYSDLLDVLLDCWAQRAPRYLQKFELKTNPASLFKISKKMASLSGLTHLHIKVGAMILAEDVHALGNLPNLLLLNLTSYGTSKRCIISKDGFQRLKVFVFECPYGPTGLQFKPGAMPQLRRLRMSLRAGQTRNWFGDFDFGIQHLSCLVHVRAIIICRDARASDVEAAEEAIANQVSYIPNNPALELSRLDRHRVEKDEEMYISWRTIILSKVPVRRRKYKDMSMGPSISLIR